MPFVSNSVTMSLTHHIKTSGVMNPPVNEPITPIKVSERWFPKGRGFCLYECGGRVAPNVTSILSWKFPFDKAKWKK